MLLRISCFVRLPAYQTLLEVEPLNGDGVVAAWCRIACIDIGEVGSAPEATAFVDGRLFLHVAVPVVVLSNIGQTAVVSILNEQRLLCDRKFATTLSGGPAWGAAPVKLDFSQTQ